jgi:hypothetical protein
MAIQSNVVWNRELTQVETESIQTQADVAVAAGTTDGIITGAIAGPDQIGPVTRIWTTTDAANSWVAFLNTFSPAPISATVTS